jgi:hypothetical protein
MMVKRPSTGLGKVTERKYNSLDHSLGYYELKQNNYVLMKNAQNY